MEIVRHTLNVGAEDLTVAATAIDSALNVSSARAAAAVGRRKDGMCMLHGTNVLADTIEGKRGSVVQKRSISLDAVPLPESDAASTVVSVAKRKRPSGPSNWPDTPERRRQMELRKAELARLRELELREVARREATASSGAAALGLAALFSDQYVPTEEEHRALTSLREAVADAMGVTPEELETPQACCTCVRDRNPRRLEAYEEAHTGKGASIAVDGSTACVEFSVAEAPPPLQAGEAIIYPLGAPQRPPVGEWVVTLQFRTKARADAATPTTTARSMLVELSSNHASSNQPPVTSHQ